jgi:hypothetical protein
VQEGVALLRADVFGDELNEFIRVARLPILGCGIAARQREKSVRRSTPAPWRTAAIARLILARPALALAPGMPP